MRLRHVKTLPDLADAGSPTAASEQLERSPSPLTGHFRRKEGEAGFPLFRRPLKVIAPEGLDLVHHAHAGSVRLGLSRLGQGTSDPWDHPILIRGLDAAGTFLAGLLDGLNVVLANCRHPPVKVPPTA